jgi:hypothetical protein
MNYYEYGSSRNVVISNSLLSTINPEEDGHPLKTMQFLEKKLEEKDTKSINSGKLIHAYVENPRNFAIADFEKPSSDMMCKLIYILSSEGYNSRTYTQYLDDAAELAGYSRKPKELDDNQKKYLDYLNEISEKEYAITKQESEILLNQINSLKSNLKINDELFNNYDDNADILTFNEVWINFKIPAITNIHEPIFIKDFEIEIPVKVLIDRLIINRKTLQVKLIDLKSTRSIPKFQSSFEYYRYYRQLALYRLGLKKLIVDKATVKDKYGQDFTIDLPNKNLNSYKFYTYIIAVENNGNYLTQIFDIPESWLNYGLEEAKVLSERLAWHIINNNWLEQKESYLSAGIMKIEPKKSDLREIVERIQNKLSIY